MTDQPPYLVQLGDAQTAVVRALFDPLPRECWVVVSPTSKSEHRAAKRSQRVGGAMDHGLTAASPSAKTSPLQWKYGPGSPQRRPPSAYLSVRTPMSPTAGRQIRACRRCTRRAGSHRQGRQLTRWSPSVLPATQASHCPRNSLIGCGSFQGLVDPSGGSVRQTPPPAPDMACAHRSQAVHQQGIPGWSPRTLCPYILRSRCKHAAEPVRGLEHGERRHAGLGAASYVVNRCLGVVRHIGKPVRHCGRCHGSAGSQHHNHADEYH